MRLCNPPIGRDLGRAEARGCVQAWSAHFPADGDTQAVASGSGCTAVLHGCGPACLHTHTQAWAVCSVLQVGSVKCGWRATACVPMQLCQRAHTPVHYHVPTGCVPRRSDAPQGSWSVLLPRGRASSGMLWAGPEPGGGLWAGPSRGRAVGGAWGSPVRAVLFPYSGASPSSW